MADDSLAIFEKIASAIAEGHEPDLSSFDASEVRTALGRVLQYPGPRQNFVAWLNGRVRVLSGGRVSVEERPTEDAVTTPDPAPPAVPELPVRVLVAGEQFAEPAVVRAEGNAVQFPMRG
ncbi:hypothetical protein [Microbacterium deminutum]|uniref:2,3,4,5-tetrahydropyridine-2,6-dicarboxylate N-succinyltransferase n=1 Tax=Microbacterium deminutum TaxID=344164 RepID=A0ABN2R2K7_9MICO